MTDPPSPTAISAELRAAVRQRLSDMQQLHCDLMETIAKSRATIAESTTLIAMANKALPPK